MSATGDIPDWRDAQAYAPLLRAERAVFAWEWLRRNPAYRAAAALAGGPAGDCAERPRCVPALAAQPEAGAWGLHVFEDPGMSALSARPLWRAEAYPFVLRASASSEGEGRDRLDLARIAMSTLVARSAAGLEHVLISDGLRSIRLDIVRGSLLAGPARLTYELAGLVAAERPLRVLQRLLAVHRVGCFSATLHRREARAARWVLLLRTHDAIEAGASQRLVAAHLLSQAASAVDWRYRTPSLRSQAQRLVRGARLLAAGGYRRFLQ